MKIICMCVCVYRHTPSSAPLCECTGEHLCPCSPVRPKVDLEDQSLCPGDSEAERESQSESNAHLILLLLRTAEWRESLNEIEKKHIVIVKVKMYIVKT